MKNQNYNQSDLQQTLSAKVFTTFMGGLGLLAIILLLAFKPVIGQNPIITENALTGNPPSEWEIYDENESIQGFATELSVNKGSTVYFKIDVDPATDFTMKIYRIGYYQGNGARVQADLGTIAGIKQPTNLYYPDTKTTDCSNWYPSAQWTVPVSAVSGIYFAKIVRTDNGGANHITFIVRDDEGTSPILYKTSDETWQAYNYYGGSSLYCDANGGGVNHATKVSTQRPFITRYVHCVGGDSQWFRSAEYPLIRWMERNGYDVSYTTQLDMARDATPITLLMHKILISCGHDEYWSAECRTKWETARNNGVNLCFMSGNEVYWKTRWEPNLNGTPNTPYQTLVCYKEGTMGEYVCGGNCDPTSTWTGLWRDGCGSAYAPPNSVDGCNNESTLTGQMSWRLGNTYITVPDTYKNMRFWKNTAVANLGAGQSQNLTDGTLGIEWDPYQSTATYPPRRILLSNTVVGELTHNLSLYRHSSGALVFGAGTFNWSWGLDGVHDFQPSIEDINVQQATVNLFAYMGVPPVPGQLQALLIYETGASSSTPPVSVITSPLNNAVLSSSTVTITGTASVPGGGVLLGVEVSFDGGTTWFPASGTTNWTFSWNPTTQGTNIIKSRGWDDLGNMEVPGPVGSSNCISVTFNGPSVFSVFLPNQPAADPGTGTNNQPIEVGMRFSSSLAGYITSLKYYKTAVMTGVHTGHLWSNTGTLLATATFTNETSSGWQTATLATPFPITASTLYVVSTHSPSFQFAYSQPYFTSDVVNPPLTAPATQNGCYSYCSANPIPPVFPTITYNATNYWVDVSFATTLGPDVTPPSVSTMTPSNNATGVPVITHPTVTFSEALDPTTVNTNTFILTGPGITPVSGTVSYSSGTNMATFTPSASLAVNTLYTVRVVGGTTDPRIKDVNGNAMLSDYSWTFTTEDYYPVVTLHPSTQSTCSGSSISFSSAATGNPTPTLQWQVNNGVNGWQDILNATSSPYTFTAAIEDNTKQYRAAWTNSGGTAYSNSATLTVVATITGTIGTTNANICLGNPYELQLTAATGQPPYSVVVDGITSASVSVGQTFATIIPAQSIWGNAGPYETVTNGQTIEVGTKFRSAIPGLIYGVRFYKGPQNTGTHVAHLWTAGGTLLATATFTAETASGWQEVRFTSPVAILANTTYIASYFSNSTYFSGVAGYFLNNGVTNGPLTAPQHTAGDPNGLYKFGASGFPTLGLGAFYCVDVLFGSAPATITAQLTYITDANGCTNSGNPLSSVTVNINAIPAGIISSAGTVCDGSNMSLVFNATAGTGPFGLIVNGNSYTDISNGASFNVGTTGTSNQAQSIWPSAVGITHIPENPSVELGVKFRSNEGGQITGIRFYKSSAQTGPFTGSLWTSTGTNLATANFTSFTSSGWQQVNFATPVTILPNVTYVASYHTANGNYYNEVGYFASSGVTNGALTALQAGVDGENGVYKYGPTTTFPDQPPLHSNYWVDVVFAPSYNANNYFALTSITSTNGCVKTGNPISTTIVPVNPLPTVTWPNALTSQCVSSTSYVLTGGSPSGGSYSGAGVSGNVFNASLAGPGPHTLTYTYTNPATQCSNSATNTITVYALPLASASSNSPVTVGSPLNLFSGPAGMTSYLWSGPASFSSNAANPTRDPAELSYGGTYSVIVTDANGCSATASTNVTVNEITTALVSGNFNYFNSPQTALNDIKVELYQGGIKKYPLSGDVVTDGSGHFSFGNINLGIYDVIATTTKTAGGINVTDAAQTNYWGVFFGGIQKVRFYAGDVVMNNHIDGNDASLILQYFLTQGSSGWTGRPAWTFWNTGETETFITNPPSPPSTLVLPSVIVSSGTSILNLYGLVTGDFNQSFVPGGMKAGSESLTLVYGENISVIPDMEFDLPLSVAMDMEVGAVSLIMNFPSDLIEVNGVYLSDDPNTPLMHSISGDELRIGWNSLEPVILLEGESLLTLKVKLIGIPGEEGIRFKLAADPLNELADGDYNVIDNAVLSIDIITSSMTGTGEISLSDRLTLANHPNPFTGKTTFAYSLPVDGKVTLEIYDIVGNKVKSLVDVTQSAGDYVLSLDDAALQPGVYTATIKLDSSGNLMTRTIKIISKQ